MATERPKAPLLVIENDISGPIAELGAWLREAGAELDVRCAAVGEAVPADLDGYSGLIVMGGAMGARDDDRAPWLPDVRALLSQAVRAELPALGVCLGAQLLAVATGGRVQRAELPEYGAQLIAKRQAAATDPLLRELPITPDVLQWHVDEVSQLPPSAVLLASSPGTEVQAFRVGRLAWGFQFHIETTPEIVAAWADEDAEDLTDYDVERILSRSAAVHADIAEVWQPVAETFVRIAADPITAAGPRTLPMAGARAAPTSMAGPITDPAAIRAALAAEMQAARAPHGH